VSLTYLLRHITTYLQPRDPHGANSDMNDTILINYQKHPKLEGCIVLNKHSSIRLKWSAVCNMSFPGPRVLNANGISITSEFSAGLTS